MARKAAPETPKIEKETKVVPRLGDAIRKDKNLVTFSMGVDPVILIPIDQIGLEVALHNAGFPLNRISMSIADAHAGKTTFSHLLANFFLRANGDVILLEGDEALDETYVSRLYDYTPTTHEEAFKAPLEHFIEVAETKLKKEGDGVHITIQLRKKLGRQIAFAKALLEKGSVNEENPVEKEMLFIAQCAYRMQHVVRESTAKTAEDMEAFITAVLKKKEETDPTGSRPTLIIIDPISNYIPNEMAEQEDSASGRKMSMASYLQQFFRRWTRPLAQANVHLHLTCKKSTFIGADPYAFYSELDKMPTIGGGSQKLASSLLFYFEMGREVKTPTADQEALVEGAIYPFREGRVKIPKKKTQGGYSMPKEFRTSYWLFTDRKCTRMDFDLPFMEQVFKHNLFGIVYKGGYVLIDPKYIGDNFAERRNEVENDKKKPDEIGKVKARRSEAVKILTASEPWKIHIRTTMGINHQTIGDQDIESVSPVIPKIEGGDESPPES